MPSTSGIPGQLFDTVGLEVEGHLKQRDEMQSTVLPKLSRLMGEFYSRISLDRDASTESFVEAMRIGGRILYLNTHTAAYQSLSKSNVLNSQVFGYEFKTKPLELTELERVLYPLMWVLYEHGDVISDRASIHVHVGYANNFRMLQSLLTMMLGLEPVLYRLGGMGGTFRGHLNNAAYCRPLLNSCVVPVIKMSHSKTYAQILNPIAARSAENITQFWANMGVDSRASSQHKYHSSRYAGMNFFALYSHGTVEWRYFNKSFDVPLVIGIVKLMRGVVETSSLVTRRDLRAYDVIDSSKEISVGDAEGILSMTLAMCHDKGVGNLPSDNEMAHILEVLRESHFTPLPELPTLTHINDFAVQESLVTKGGLRLFEKYLPNNYVDVHNIQEKLMSILS